MKHWKILDCILRVVIFSKKKKRQKDLVIFSLKSWQVLIRLKFKLLLMTIWLSGISSCLYPAEWNIKLSHDWPLSDFKEGLGRLEALDWRDRGESSKSPRPSSCPKSSDLRHHKEKGRFPCAMRKGRPKPPSHPRRPPCCKIFYDSLAHWSQSILAFKAIVVFGSSKKGHQW